jgi:hypothetical protein
MSRLTVRTAAVAALTALSIAAVPALAHAEDNDSDPSPAGNSCTMTDGTVLEDGETHIEFQSEDNVLELTCNDGTLCGTTFSHEHPGIPVSFACESWGETVQLRSEAPRARVLGVLVTTSDGTYRVRRVASRARVVAKQQPQLVRAIDR